MNLHLRVYGDLNTWQSDRAVFCNFRRKNIDIFRRDYRLWIIVNIILILNDYHHKPATEFHENQNSFDFINTMYCFYNKKPV